MTNKPFFFRAFTLLASITSSLGAGLGPVPNGTWIWVSGSRLPNAPQTTELPSKNFSSTLQPTPSYGSCMVYSSKRHQIILQTYSQVWVYDIALGQWAYLWAGPGNALDGPTIFTAPGMPSNARAGPSKRMHCACALDTKEDTFWLFGGWIAPPNTSGDTDQLWSFDLLTLRWTFWYGSIETNTPMDIATNKIGGRMFPHLSVDPNGRLIIFYGSRFANLWAFNPKTLTMLCLAVPPLNGGSSASVSYGTNFVTSRSNNPPIRDAALMHLASNGSLYVFGGLLNSEGIGDTLRFDYGGPTQYQWTTLRGANAPAAAVYPHSSLGVFNAVNKPRSRYRSTIASNSAFDFFAVYGGPLTSLFATTYAPGCTDLWIFNTTTSEWSLFWGDASCGRTLAPVYPIQTNTISSLSSPGARAEGTAIVDKNGVIWLYGGGNRFMVPSAQFVMFNDLWAYTNTNCDPGEYFSLKSYICEPCGKDTYTPTRNSNTACIACPENSTTAGRLNSTTCLCSSGFYGNPLNGGCLPCPAGTLKRTAGNGDITACQHMTSASKSTISATSSIPTPTTRSSKSARKSSNVAPTTSIMAGDDNGSGPGDDGSSVYTYIGIGVGAAVLLGSIGVVLLARRRRERRTQQSLDHRFAPQQYHANLHEAGPLSRMGRAPPNMKTFGSQVAINSPTAGFLSSSNLIGSGSMSASLQDLSPISRQMTPPMPLGQHSPTMMRQPIYNPYINPVHLSNTASYDRLYRVMYP